MEDNDFSDIKLLSKDYEQGYIAMHNNDLYWTADKVIKAKDKFKTYVAIEDGKVVGYIDVTKDKKDNSIFDFLIKEEYRQKGFGRKLLSKALKENEVETTTLTVDIDNIPAINLYKSLGFKKKSGNDVQVCSWKIK